MSGPDASHLLIISQESGRIVDVDRSGHVSSSLTIPADPGNPLSVPDQTHEGVTMGDDGRIYTVSEEGGGDAAHPQLWVYAPSAAQHQAPTAVTLANQVHSIPRARAPRRASRSRTSPSPTTASGRTP
ncbi:SdiA-regulated domain-containing protein [Candidatus Solirubrobacter pratensis]|uniref:SdiA-regulated domain-containing protein n=1 Tax=Candidatus Solirubrobacter pratensis TaxID=1298857 RepID=UPI000410D4C8|nr:SdiA-regulated domain-containing protein [Candidatus Solirubrobacter pratensis]